MGSAELAPGPDSPVHLSPPGTSTVAGTCTPVSGCCSPKPWPVQATHKLVTRLANLY